MKEILQTIKSLWDGVVNPSEPFAVYAARAGVFEAFREDADTSTAEIHATIAARENNHLSRFYAGTVQPGSFNIARVAARNADEAVALAKAQGLVHEPLKTVLARFINKGRERTAEADALMRAYEEFGRMFKEFGEGSAPRREP